MPLYINKSEMLNYVTELASEKQHTYEIQVTLQNIDLKKNQRFATDCILPFQKRLVERILIVADKPVEEECIRLNITRYDKATYQTDKPSIVYVTYDDVASLEKEKKRLKKKLCSMHHSIIATSSHSKAFEMRFITGKRIPLLIIRQAQELEKMIESAKKTVRLAIRKTPNVYYPVGHTKMEAEQVVENIVVTLQRLSEAMKKNEGQAKKVKEHIKGVMLKSTRSKAKSLIVKKTSNF